MLLKDSELHIWRLRSDIQEYHAEKLSPLLSEEERKRCNAYLNEAEKIRYVCNHRFVRRVLARYLNVSPGEITFSHARQGKPFIKNSNLCFSYSYRDNLGLLGISKSEVGVDIEKMKTLQDLKTFADFSFSEQEKEIIFKNDVSNLQETLFTFWTFKEAIIKCLGVGLNADLTQIDLSEFFYKDVDLLNFDKNSYTIRRLAADEGFKAAFAIKGEVKDLLEFDDRDLV